MKGFFACTLDALRRIPVHKLERELLLAWTYDEEVGCLGSHHLVEAFQDESRPVPSACLIGEPTDFRILRMHSGHQAVRVVVRGEAAHSSRPDLGLNAIEGAAAVVGILREVAAELALAPLPIPELERPIVPLNIATIRGGAAVNVVPDRCEVEFGYRPLPGQDARAVFREVQARVAALDGPWQIDMAPLHGIAALDTARNTPLEALLQDFATDPTPGAAGFATDGGNLARLDTHPLIFGPGSIDVAHKADEYVTRSSLTRGVDVLEALIRARTLSA